MKTDRLFELLEDASRRVKTWPDWKRSEDSKRELERLALERQKDECQSFEHERPVVRPPAPGRRR